MNLHNMREEYALNKLEEKNTPNNPIELFQEWFNNACDTKYKSKYEPNAMTLSTCDNGRSHSRIVLLKEFTNNGEYIFYTNYKSDKSKELQSTHFCSLNFYWAEIERQVRIEGFVIKIPPQESDKYFSTRPIGSRISAIVSKQSSIIYDTEDNLNKIINDLNDKYDENNPPDRPPYWGGYCVIPDSIEFWQGRKNRFHSRIKYIRNISYDKYFSDISCLDNYHAQMMSDTIPDISTTQYLNIYTSICTDVSKVPWDTFRCYP